MAGNDGQRGALTRLDYPPGTRIELINMPEDPRPIAPGTRGNVQGVDGAGQILMKWDNGRTLSLIPGVDCFRKLTQQEIQQEQASQKQMEEMSL